MDDTYPSGPAAVPADLTKPTAAYRHHAWLAMGGLALFIVLYLLLSGWFAWTAWHLLRVQVSGGGGLWTLVATLGSAFLAVFMLKALFFVKPGQASEDVPITAAEQPRLFAFLHRLADEAGAPRPHKVYLSNRVNAAVFYDLSIANLIVPSRKNLEIGLALVNVLSLGELKAVLAHEFGHFAQRTMYVGRWVYIGQQIAAHIIAKRDALDRLLSVISGLDLRIAWVGWGLSLIVWSIRSVMEIVFRLVILAQRALSREMEFQADLVAVSLTGSDALVHALHRLTAADNAWSRAVNFAGAELSEGRRVRDVFTLQTRVIEQLARVLGQPDLGNVPPLPAEKPEAHRVFKVQLAQPPRMWLTHPPSSEREDNCKRRYVPATIDARSAWDLFDDVPALRERLSEKLFRTEKPVEPVPLEDSLKRLDEQFGKAYLDRAYRGSYLARSVARHVSVPDELYGELPPAQGLVAELGSLYPESLGEDIERLRELEEEQGTLLALQSGALTAPNGIIRHRGRELKRGELQGAIEALGAEIEAVQARVLAHHRRCRTAHLAAARSLGKGWPEYLQGLTRLLHYAEHAEANLLDARGYFGNVYAIVTADRKVSTDELDELIAAGDALFNAIHEVFEQREAVKLDRTMARRLSKESWSGKLEPLKLVSPTRENMSQWLQVIDGWVGAYGAALSALKLAALEQLLNAEAQIARFVREGMQPGEAPPPSQAPSKYTLRSPGMERQRRTALSWWERFQAADGAVATLARLAAAAVIVGAVIYLGRSIGEHTVAVYNGLERLVSVTIASEHASLPPFGSVRLKLPESDSYRIETRTADGQVIEAFDAPFGSGGAAHIYNVAGAAPLLQWTAVYGGGGSPPSRRLDTARWQTSHADYVFEEPPRTMSSRGPRTQEVVQAPPAETSPLQIAAALEGDASRPALIKTHALWDDTHSRHLAYWLSLAEREQGFEDILARRLQAHPDDVPALRAEQDAATGDAHHKVCERHRAMAQAAPTNADLQYVAARCIEDPHEQNEAFLSLADRWPMNGWVALGVASVRVGREEWPEAVRRFQQARNAEPAVATLLGLTLARLERVTETADAADLGNLARDSAELSQLLSLETGNVVNGYSPEGPATAYTELARGKLEAAVTRAHADASTSARVVRLAAASDGASPALVRAALALPPDQGIDDSTAWTALALAAREGTDTKPLVAYINTLPGDEPRLILRFFEHIRTGRLAADEARLLEAQSPAARGHAYAMAATLRGEAAPPEWRWLAMRLLFAPERPYFHPTRAPALRDSAPPIPPSSAPDTGHERIPPRLVGF